MRAHALHLLTATTASALAASAAHAVDVALPRLLASPEPVAYDIFGSDIAVATPSILAAGVRGADGFGLNAGAVELFERGAKGWTFRERLAAPGVASGDQLGETVAAGGGWIFAAATRHDAVAGDAGAVWVYRADGSAWVHAQTLLPTGAAAGARFGSSIAVDGGVAAIGAPGSGGGEVRVFELVKGQWTATATIAIPTGNPFNRFGEAVALSGGRLFVGDPNDDVGAYDGGAVFAYEKIAGTWTLSATLRAATPEVRGNFGRSVSASGARVAVGVPGAAANGGDGAAVAAAGRVDLFSLSAGSFAPAGSLSPAPANAVVGGNYGWSVELEAEALVVGAPGESASGGAGGDVARAGRTAVYARSSGGAWNPVLALALDAPAANEVLGTSVALSGGVLAIGAPGAMLQGAVKGAAIAFALDADCDADGLPDDLEILLGAGDCDGDGVPDACERDTDGDGIPDACECPYDLDGDGEVGATDLAFALGYWGPVTAGTPDGVDINGDGFINAADLAVMLAYWGDCG